MILPLEPAPASGESPAATEEAPGVAAGENGKGAKTPGSARRKKKIPVKTDEAPVAVAAAEVAEQPVAKPAVKQARPSRSRKPKAVSE